MANILFTHNLKKKHETLLSGVDFNYESQPLIDIKIHDFKKESFSESDVDFWVFTSKNAVKFIAQGLGELEIPPKVFAVGSSTAKKLLKIGIEPVIPNEFSSEALSDLILSHEVKQGVHFCGNLAEDDIVKNLEDGNISLSKKVVYKTVLTPAKIDVQKYDGVAFLSPSAFESFCEKNNPEKIGKAFCIGSTTADAVKKSFQGEVIIPPKSTFNELAKIIDQSFKHVVS